MGEKMDVTKRTLDALRDFATRLRVAGGDIHATGLRVTTVRRCGCDSGCKKCNWTCVLRVVSPPKGSN